MTDSDDKVRVQQQKFNAELPTFLQEYPHWRGHWVVFLDGVQYAGPDRDIVHRWAISQYGLDGGFVIAQVTEQKPLHVSQLGSAGWALVQREYDALKAKYNALQDENSRLRAVAIAAAKVRNERVAFLAIAKAACPVRSPALEQAEAEMDAALDELEGT